MARVEDELAEDYVKEYDQVNKSSSGHSINALNLQMIFFGISCVLFWSILLIQIPFIKDYFGGPSILFFIPLVYGLFSNISRVFVLINHARSRYSTGKKLAQLIYAGASITAIGMCCIPVVMAGNGTTNPEIGFWLCLLILAVVGSFNSLLVTGGFALMSIVPRGSGQFFLLGLTATGIVTWPFFMLLRYIASVTVSAGSVDILVATVSLCISATLCLCSIPVYRFLTSRHEALQPQLERSSTDPDGRGLVQVFRAIWVPALAMWFARVVTFALYPGLIGLYSPSSDASYSKSHYQSFLIYLGPLSDTVGQLVYRYTNLRKIMGIKGMLIFTTTRAVVIVPVFLLSAWMDNSHESFIRQDWFRCLMMFGFSFSMGINYSAGNALAPLAVSSTDEKYIVGIILSFVAMNGLFVGSLVGVGLKQLF